MSSNVNGLSSRTIPNGRRGGNWRQADGSEEGWLRHDEVLALVSALELVLAILRRKVKEGAPAREEDIHPSRSLRSPVPPVDIRSSVTNDYIICLEDGAKVKSLKSYLRRFGMTPDQYRMRWGLPPSYPVVAPALSEKRAALARRVKPHLSRKQTKPE